MDLIFRESNATDENALHAILDEYPMTTSGMKVVYDRRPSFIKLLSFQAEHFKTLVGEESQKLIGFVSFSWGKRLHIGNPITALYIGDFRVQLNRKAGLMWRNYYPKLIESFLTSSEYGPVQMIYTAILKENQAAFQSLVKARKNKSFFYHPLKELTMVNLVARKPKLFQNHLNSSPLPIESAENVGEQALRKFLCTVNNRYYLGYDFSNAPGNEWDRRKNTWPNYELKNFKVALDPDSKEIKACYLPWSPTAAKRLQVTRISLSLNLLCRALNILNIKAPVANAPIDILYLTHLYFDASLDQAKRAEVLSSFIHDLYRDGTRNHFHLISFADSENLRKQNPLKAFVFQETAVNVFTVSNQKDAPPVPASAEISFEMALV